MSKPEQPGLFDGFEGYRTPSPEDLKGVISAGLIVLDANVLLNLYRYTDQARDDLLSVLEKAREHVWVPHQALLEFWRNREDVLRDPRDVNATADDLEGLGNRAIQRLRQWTNRVSLPQEEAEPLIAQLRASFSSVIEAVYAFNDSTTADFARQTSNDPVLSRLEAILARRVGNPLDSESHAKALLEAERRIEQKEPPGYRDKAKGDDQAAGDYLVWEQTLCEAAARNCDVLLITADAKDDWWRKEGGEHRGPRIELVVEMRQRAGQRLFMMRPTQFLEAAGDLLSIDVSEQSLLNADAVDKLGAEGPLLDGGWNADAFEALIKRLGADYPVQSEVLKRAAINGGSVDRKTVFDIGGYPDDRQLKGFTRPIVRVAQELRDDGSIHEEAEDLLEAYYQGLSGNPSLADGFRLNRAVLSLAMAVVERRFAD